MSVEVGKDEFCSNCMEWREYDEEGKCKVCGKIIFKKKVKNAEYSYAEYEREKTDFEETEE